jgi:nicotinate-nucleotide adenylyltransferase
VFNPPHIGHLVCAQEAWWQMELDEVLLMPVGEAPHRTLEHDPGAEERFELCRLAVEGVDWLTASREEVDRPGPSYTADTLERLGEPDLVLILGADQALQLATWHEPERVLRAATLAIVERGGVPIEEVQRAVSAAGEARVQTFTMPRIDVSSSELRARVADGRPYRFLVPERVAERIERVGRYR